MRVKATLLWPAHSDTSRTLQPAAHEDGHETVAEPVERDVVEAGALDGGPQHRLGEGPEERSAGGGGEHQVVGPDADALVEMLLDPGHPDRATGMVRRERVVFGSLSSVTTPRIWTAVPVTSTSVISPRRGSSHVADTIDASISIRRRSASTRRANVSPWAQPSGSR